MAGVAAKHINRVPRDKRSKKDEVSSGKATLEIKAKKNAPSPKADSGNAVAVPL